MNERRTGTDRSHRGSNPKERAVGKKGPRPGAPGARPRVTDASAEQVKIGDRIVVTIKRIGINGEGVGYYRKKSRLPRRRSSGRGRAGEGKRRAR
ncbi:hypothetical protein [Paenibacillus thiaminolyticus]|uniref:hypothetical protein n=1 Tax=Paenibacillus thiaminolyticus TaxID=49283 RepID=UPI003B97FD88